MRPRNRKTMSDTELLLYTQQALTLVYSYTLAGLREYADGNHKEAAYFRKKASKYDKVYAISFEECEKRGIHGQIEI